MIRVWVLHPVNSECDCLKGKDMSVHLGHICINTLSASPLSSIPPTAHLTWGSKEGEALQREGLRREDAGLRMQTLFFFFFFWWFTEPKQWFMDLSFFPVWFLFSYLPLWPVTYIKYLICRLSLHYSIHTYGLSRENISAVCVLYISFSLNLSKQTAVQIWYTPPCSLFMYSTISALNTKYI